MIFLKAQLMKYPLPDFLEGKIDHITYYKWLTVKAFTLLKRDRRREKAYAVNATKALYREKIHDAVIKCGRFDPYTGDVLDWKLIGTWDTSGKHPDGYKKLFALMPTVDHVSPDTLSFEICSWMSNDCKSDLLPGELVEFCKKVVKFRG